MEFKWIEFDPERANAMLDEIIPDKDSEGYRTLPNGDRLELSVILFDGWASWADTTELVLRQLDEKRQDSWKDARRPAQPDPDDLVGQRGDDVHAPVRHGGHLLRQLQVEVHIRLGRGSGALPVDQHRRRGGPSSPQIG